MTSVTIKTHETHLIERYRAVTVCLGVLAIVYPIFFEAIAKVYGTSLPALWQSNLYLLTPLPVLFVTAAILGIHAKKREQKEALRQALFSVEEIIKIEEFIGENPQDDMYFKASETGLAKDICVLSKREGRRVFVIYETIAKGGTSVVSKALDWHTMHFYAHCLKMNGMNGEADNAHYIETYLKQKNARHIVEPGFGRIRLGDEQVSELYELYEGNLAELLKKGTLSDQEKWEIIEKLIVALHDMELLSVFHLDYQLDNIFYKRINGKLEVRVGDFGCSVKPKSADEEHDVVYKRGYQSPEIIRAKGLDGRGCKALVKASLPKQDVWALGSMIADILGKVRPPDAFGALISQMRDVNYETRITAREVLERFQKIK